MKISPSVVRRNLFCGAVDQDRFEFLLQRTDRFAQRRLAYEQHVRRFCKTALPDNFREITKLIECHCRHPFCGFLLALYTTTAKNAVYSSARIFRSIILQLASSIILSFSERMSNLTCSFSLASRDDRSVYSCGYSVFSPSRQYSATQQIRIQTRDRILSPSLSLLIRLSTSGRRI